MDSRSGARGHSHDLDGSRLPGSFRGHWSQETFAGGRGDHSPAARWAPIWAGLALGAGPGDSGSVPSSIGRGDGGPRPGGSVPGRRRGCWCERLGGRMAVGCRLGKGVRRSNTNSRGRNRGAQGTRHPPRRPRAPCRPSATPAAAPHRGGQTGEAGRLLGPRRLPEPRASPAAAAGLRPGQQPADACVRVINSAGVVANSLPNDRGPARPVIA